MARSSSTIRSARPIDLDSIVRLAVDADLFSRDDVGVVANLLGAIFAGEVEGRCLVSVTEAGVAAVVIAQDRLAADRVWEVTMLAVDPRRRRLGDGTALMLALEQTLIAAGQRLIVVETSSSSVYEGARAFYAARGYSEQTRVPDYWSDGDDLVLFSRRLPARGPA